MLPILGVIHRAAQVLSQPAVPEATPQPGDLIPSTWTFVDLTGAVASVAGLDIVKLPFFALLALSILILVASRLKRAIKAGK
jgi:hypothetical protein